MRFQHLVANGFTMFLFSLEEIEQIFKISRGQSKFLIGLILSQMPDFGRILKEVGENFMGTSVRLQTENSKLFKRQTNPIFDCKIPKRNPMQFLGPKNGHINSYKNATQHFANC